MGRGAPNHAEGVYEIRNLLRYGIDCEAIVWNHHEVMYGKGGLLAARAHPRPAPGVQAPRSSGGVIEPIPARQAHGNYVRGVPQPTQKGHPRVPFALYKGYEKDIFSVL